MNFMLFPQISSDLATIKTLKKILTLTMVSLVRQMWFLQMKLLMALSTFYQWMNLIMALLVLTHSVLTRLGSWTKGKS